jgi:hypothetical protein
MRSRDEAPADPASTAARAPFVAFIVDRNSVSTS